MAAYSLMKLYSSTMLWDHLSTAILPEMALLSIDIGFRLAYFVVMLNQPCQNAAWTRRQPPWLGLPPWAAWCVAVLRHESLPQSMLLPLDVEIGGRLQGLPSSPWSWQRLVWRLVSGSSVSSSDVMWSTSSAPSLACLQVSRSFLAVKSDSLCVNTCSCNCFSWSMNCAAYVFHNWTASDKNFFHIAWCWLRARTASS